MCDAHDPSNIYDEWQAAEGAQNRAFLGSKRVRMQRQLNLFRRTFAPMPQCAVCGARSMPARFVCSMCTTRREADQRGTNALPCMV